MDNSSRIKILYVLNTCRNCGPVQVIFNIIKNLDYSKYEPIILTLAKEPHDSKIDEILPYVSKHILCETHKKDIIFNRIDYLKKCINQISPDVIHTTGVFPDFAISKILPNSQIITMHNYAPFDYVSEYGLLIGHVLKCLQYSAVRKARKTIACSESLSKLYSNEGFNFKYIRNGIDVKKFNKYKKAEKMMLREKLGLKKEPFTFIYTGRFIKRKNVNYMVDGFSRVYGNNPKIQFILLGDGPKLLALKKKYKKIDNIVFMGNVADVNEYLAASDAYISASKSEGMPNAVLEAMACGLPVLLSDILQHKEIMVRRGRGDGVTVFSLKQRNDYYNKLQTIYQNARTKGYDARYNVKLNFNSKNMSMQYQAEYEKIFHKNRFLSKPAACNTIKYSIIVPAYNVEKYIGRCLTSLINQKCDNMEIIVIDDGSTDNTLKIAKAFEQRNARLRVYHQDNVGLVATRKRGVDKSKGIYCMTVDADDWISNDTMKVIDKYINIYGDIDVLKFRFVYEPSGKVSKAYKYCLGRLLNTKELDQLHRDLLLTDNYNNLCNQVFKKKDYLNAYHDELKEIQYGEDLVVNFGLIGIAKKVLFINDALYHYFENPESITHKMTEQTFSKYLQDSVGVYMQSMKYVASANQILVDEDVVKNILMNAICERIRQYISHGGKIDQGFKDSIEKTKIHDIFKGVRLKNSNRINQRIGKNLLARKYNRLRILKPYMGLRQIIRRAYHSVFSVKKKLPFRNKKNVKKGAIYG